MDECEVSNHEYGDFVFWYQRVFNANNSGLQSTHEFAGVQIDPNDPASEGGLYNKILQIRTVGEVSWVTTSLS